MHSKALALFLAFFVLCSTIAPSQAWDVPEVIKKQVKKLHKRCVAKTNVSEEIINEAHKGTLPNDQGFKCFIHCMFDMFGLIDNDNNMHLESLLEVVPVDIHPKIINLSEACGTQKGHDGCEVAYQTAVCYINTDGPFIKSAVNDMLG